MTERPGAGQLFTDLQFDLLREEMKPQYVFLTGAIRAIVPYAVVEEALREMHGIIEKSALRGIPKDPSELYFNVPRGRNLKDAVMLVVAKQHNGYKILY